MRPHLEYYVQLWGVQYKTDMDLSKWVQRGDISIEYNLHACGP